MGKYFLYSMLLCAVLLVGCSKDKQPDPITEQPERTVEILGGAIVINNHPDVNIDRKNEFPIGNETALFSSSKGPAAEPPEQLRANEYRFKLVSQMGTLNLSKNGKNYVAQASHVKILDEGNGGYAFVSYNYKGVPNIGGLVVYKYTVHP